MSRFRLEVRVTPRPGLLDPQGNAVHHALESLGFDAVSNVRVGRAIQLEMEAGSADEARETARDMSTRLLANPVTEDYEIRVLGEGEPT